MGRQRQCDGRPSKETMQTFIQDLRIALRTFARKPSFFVVAVATIAIGVGATTTIFSVVDGVLLTPLPYPEPDRIVRVGQVSTDPGRIYAMSYLDFKDLQARNRSFEALAAARGARVTLLGRGEPEAQSGAYVSPEFFDVVGVAPVQGRVFTPEDDAGGAPVVVIAHALWERRFDADPSLVGRALTLDGQSFTVVGVLPAGFRAPEALGQGGTQLWMPLSRIDAASRAERRNSMLQGIGRLAAGVALEGARAELELLGGQLRDEFPRESGEHHFGLSPLLRQTVGSIAGTLTALLGAVGVLLLIACGNVANLLLVRASERGREFAVRAAVGAGRGRIVRQLLTESLLIGLTGGIAGVGVASVGVRASRSTPAICRGWARSASTAASSHSRSRSPWRPASSSGSPRPSRARAPAPRWI
jgi:predicted permease